MSPSRWNRLTVTTVAALIAGQGGRSHAGNEIEIGALAGAHVFSDESALGAPGVERTGPLFGGRLGWFYRHRRHERWYGSLLGAEVELGAGPGEARGTGTGAVNLTYRAHAVAQLRTGDPAARLVPFVLVGGGAIEIVSTDDGRSLRRDRDGMGYAGAGAKLRLDRGWELRLDGRILFGPGAGGGIAEDFELLLAAGRRFGGLSR
jgi:hypothetical protein